MAFKETVTVTSMQLGQQAATKAGKQTQRHTIGYTTGEGKEKTQYFWKGSPMYDTLQQAPPNVGGTYTLAHEKNGNYWNIVSIEEGTNTSPQAATTTTNKPPYKGKSNFTPPNPDRDLSMDLGGLMHDAVTMVAAGKGNSVESTVRELYLVKQRVMASVKDGTIMATARAQPKPQQYEAATDGDPFAEESPY